MTATSVGISRTGKRRLRAGTKRLIIDSVMRRLVDERFVMKLPPGEQTVSCQDVCAVVDECRIEPDALAIACSDHAGGWSYSGSQFYNELDRALALQIGEAFASEFVECLAYRDKERADYWAARKAGSETA